MDEDQLFRPLQQSLNCWALLENYRQALRNMDNGYHFRPKRQIRSNGISNAKSGDLWLGDSNYIAGLSEPT